MEKNPGYVTASRMTDAEKKDRSKKAIAARWKKKKGEGWKSPLPEAAYPGHCNLGGEEVDCYVLSDGERVLSLRQCLKLMTGIEGSAMERYLGVEGLNSLISNEKVMEQIIDFRVPQTNLLAKGLRAETFAEIIEAYVKAAHQGLLKTDRQKEIAWKCAVVQSAFVKTGVIGLIDEATGYQSKRAKDELQIKFNAYVRDKIMEWEKTWPDELYRELARLLNIENWKRKPRCYANIQNKIYHLVDSDVASKLKELDINPNVHWHQRLTDFARIELKNKIQQVIGLARGCLTWKEFNEKMKLFEVGGSYQLAMNF